MKLDVEQEAVDLAAEHRFRSQILEALEDDSESQAGRAEVAAELAKLCALEVQVKRCADAAWNLVVLEDDSESQAGRAEVAAELAKLCALEVQVKRCADAAWNLVVEKGSAIVEGEDKLAVGYSLKTTPAVRAVGQQGAGDDTKEIPVPTEEEFLQTRLVSTEEVKRNLAEWISPMKEEYDSLVQTTGTCHPLAQEEFDAVTQDPTAAVEVLPGKLVFSIKAKSGKKKARIVGCGNHQQGPSREKTDKHASGISAEVIRLLVRYAALKQWEIATTDVRTAFLNAPLVTPNQEILIVRVPAILRTANICTERYWRLQRALYGLDVSPKSWAIFRNQTLKEIVALTDGTPVTCFPLPQDANLWEIRRLSDGETVAMLGIYVDDLAIVASSQMLETVVDTVRRPWKTSEPEIVTDRGDVSFAGYELRKENGKFMIHQKSYIKEMIKQWGIEETSAVPSVKDPPRVADRDLGMYDLTKQAQAIAGQLLWVSTHSRPDISYAVQSMCQGITSDPAAACDAGFVVMRYLKGTIEQALVYGNAPYDHGVWNELQFRRDERLLELFSDASFCADEGSRSYQCAMLFWAGALVMWSGGRQSLIAASTAEAELIGMVEGYHVGRAFLFWAGALVMWSGGRQSLIAASTAEAELIGMVEGYHVGRAFLPTVEVLCNTMKQPVGGVDQELPLVKVMYGDNAAAIQLCQLDAGAWRTRHLRLRGAIIRQAIEDLGWRVAHLPGLYMPADIGTKMLGPARFADLVTLLGFSGVPLETPPQEARTPQVAQALVVKILLTLMLAEAVQPAEAAVLSQIEDQAGVLSWLTAAGVCVGFGGYIGVSVAKWFLSKCSRQHQQVKCIEPRSPVAAVDSISQDGGGPKNDLREPLLQGSEGERLEGLSAADAPTTYEDLVGDVQQEVLAVVRRPEEYQPDYEDLVAAYPWAFQAQEDLRQRLHDSEGVVLDLEQQLHETYALIEKLRGRLRNAERFGQEYVERSDEASRALSERCKEIEELEMALREVRRENFGLNARVQRQEAEEVPGQEQPTVRRATYQDAREAHRHVQESRGSLSPRDPTVQGPPPELAVTVRRATYQDAREAHRHVQESRGSLSPRDPTVQGPPPELAVRYAGDEVWLVPAQAVQPEGDRSDEDSELEGATTSSGEYTVRERSFGARYADQGSGARREPQGGLEDMRRHHQQPYSDSNMIKFSKTKSWGF
eukprot:s749_g17.t1